MMLLLLRYVNVKRLNKVGMGGITRSYDGTSPPIATAALFHTSVVTRNVEEYVIDTI